MTNPTKEQLRWFWEQVFGKDGVEFGETVVTGTLICYRRTGWNEEDKEYNIEVIPDIDSLEFSGYLFQCVIPKLEDKYQNVRIFSFYDDLNNKVFWFAHIMDKESGDVEYASVIGYERPAFALFWVVYIAFGGSG